MPSDLGYPLLRATGDTRQRNDYTEEELARAKQRAAEIAKGSLLSPFTWAPDLMGMIGRASMNIPSISAGGRAPELSGDPIRRAAGLDPQSGWGVIGELLDPTAMMAKAPRTLATIASALPAVVRKGGRTTVRGADNIRDPRFDPRVKEQERLDELHVGLERNPDAQVPDRIPLADLEGRPIITSMADRSNAGANIVDVNGVPLYKPIRLRGGQGFMFENPGQVWASGKAPSINIMRVAQRVKKETGQDPLFIPWRMAPSATDFQTMQGELMLAHAASNMGYHAKRSLNARIKKMIPGWKGVDEPASMQQWREAPDKVRKELKNLMDVQFRDRGGLSLGEARLAISDPAQFNARHGGVQNVGLLRAGGELAPSTHPSFPMGIPGEGVGYIDQDIGIYELLGDIGRKVDDPLNPSPQDTRSLMMGAKDSIITDKVLKKLQDRGIDTAVLPLTAIIGAAFAYDLIDEPKEQKQ